MFTHECMYLEHINNILVVLVLSCMCPTSLCLIINVARGPEGHIILCQKEKGTIIFKTFLLF